MKNMQFRLKEENIPYKNDTEIQTNYYMYVRTINKKHYTTRKWIGRVKAYLDPLCHHRWGSWQQIYFIKEDNYFKGTNTPVITKVVLKDNSWETCSNTSDYDTAIAVCNKYYADRAVKVDTSPKLTGSNKMIRVEIGVKDES